MDCNNNNIKIVSRFAPSPTGLPHLGSAMSFLLPYCFVKKNDGIIICRIDDTDLERSKERYTQEIMKSLNWLYITPDNKFRQSDRIDRYNEVFNLLKNNNFIYACSQTKEECEAIKMKKLNKNRSKNNGTVKVT